MTPQLSVLVNAADVAKSALAVYTSANETAAQLADAAVQRHKDAYAAVQKAVSDLQAARTAIDAALDADYGTTPDNTLPTNDVPFTAPVVVETLSPVTITPEVAPEVVAPTAAAVDVVMADGVSTSEVSST